MKCSVGAQNLWRWKRASRCSPTLPRGFGSFEPPFRGDVKKLPWSGRKLVRFSSLEIDLNEFEENGVEGWACCWVVRTSSYDIMMVEDFTKANLIRTTSVYMQKGTQPSMFCLRNKGSYCGNEELRVISYWVWVPSSVRASQYGRLSSRTSLSSEVSDENWAYQSPLPSLSLSSRRSTQGLIYSSLWFQQISHNFYAG